MLSAGTLFSIRLASSLTPERNVTGDTFLARLDREVEADSLVIAERGARVEGEVTGSGSALSVMLTHIYTSDGQIVPIETNSFTQVGGILPSETRITFRLMSAVALSENPRVSR
jgi:hypothetical protein